ncbi:MAG: hypothetical protein IBX63_10825 [Coriobacteriia bacterium]|nr:hypothetical protein [Coriobacteriia bacterium]
MSLTASRDSLGHAILGLLWAQWTELGVGGTRGTARSLVDPEALLLAMTVFGRYDARLFDAVLDWLAEHSDVLDVTRLRRVGSGTAYGDDRLLAALVDFMRVESSRGKWSGAAGALEAREERAAYAPEALFVTLGGEPLPAFGSADEFFGAHGFERARRVPRSISAAPDLKRPAVARLRLRTLVGQGARAEVLLYLATHDHAHGRLISQRAAYSQRQVAEYLSALAEAGYAESWGEGRTVQYRLRAHTREALGNDAAPYIDWIKTYELLTGLWTTIAKAATRSDAYEASVRLRSGLEAATEQLPVEGLALAFPDPGQHPGGKLLEHAVDYIDSVTRVLEELSC